jgi:hypothetical protein
LDTETAVDIMAAATERKTPEKIKPADTDDEQVPMTVSDEERKDMMPILEAAKAGDSASMKAAEKWWAKKIYKPIPDKFKTPRISSEARNKVAMMIAATGNSLSAESLALLLKDTLDRYSSYAKFEKDPDCAEMIKDGIGPAMKYAFRHRLA